MVADEIGHIPLHCAVMLKTVQPRCIAYHDSQTMEETVEVVRSLLGANKAGSTAFTKSGELPIHLAPLDFDDEGNAIPEPANRAMRADPNPSEYYRPHHVVLSIRYGPHPIVSQVLKRDNLTPFAEGRIDRPEMDLPSGWNGRSATSDRFRRTSSHSASPSSPAMEYDPDAEDY